VSRTLVLGTRGSALATTQSGWVADQLKAAVPDLEVRMEIIKTTGDRITDVPLAKIGGKGLFTKELEVALIEGKIDLAVHSMKDMPTELPDGLALAAVPPRETPYDALVCERWDSLAEMPEDAIIGTSSLRRAAQLWAHNPKFRIVHLRGNIDTRIKAVTEGKIAAAILASAGLRRLGRADAIAESLEPPLMIPAVAQGALALEIRADDAATTEIVTTIHDVTTDIETRAERALLARLEGGCQVPIGALARVDGDKLLLNACVCSEDGEVILRSDLGGSIDAPEKAGKAVAAHLLQQGAGELIADLR
jgi:hydroxymethylbilane synthase